MKLSATAVLFGLSAIHMLWLPLAQAADEAIATDRPDFVESSKVVGPGRVQIETSVAVERDARHGIRSRLYSTPTLLRVGVHDDWELRIESEGAMRLRVKDGGVTTSARGYADLALGAKWHAQDADDATHRPGIAWLLHVDADTGSRAFRGQGLRPSLRMVAEWELADGYSLGVMPGIFSERNDQGRRYAGGILAAVMGKSLTERLRGFVEVSGQQLAASANGGSAVTLDVGVACLVTDAVQVDTAVSRGLTRKTPDLGWTIGLSIRF